jgi:hypothetical protein
LWVNKGISAALQPPTWSAKVDRLIGGLLAD